VIKHNAQAIRLVHRPVARTKQLPCRARTCAESVVALAMDGNSQQAKKNKRTIKKNKILHLNWQII
jgi:hypothetical protein